jgi:hypothetical protein
MSTIAKTYLTALAISLAGTSLAGTSPAMAQAADPKGCTPQERSNEALQKSGQTAGVMCPPDVDPAMKAPTPQTGDSSIIPPPGNPGSNTNVQPK